MMLFHRFARDRRGSASRWFALAAVAITLMAAVGAHGLAWLANSGRVPVIAFIPLNDAAGRSQQGRGIDMTATGSIRPAPGQASGR